MLNRQSPRFFMAIASPQRMELTVLLIATEFAAHFPKVNGDTTAAASGHSGRRGRRGDGVHRALRLSYLQKYRSLSGPWDGESLFIVGAPSPSGVFRTASQVGVLIPQALLLCRQKALPVGA